MILMPKISLSVIRLSSSSPSSLWGRGRGPYVSSNHCRSSRLKLNNCTNIVDKTLKAPYQENHRAKLTQMQLSVKQGYRLKRGALSARLTSFPLKRRVLIHQKASPTLTILVAMKLPQRCRMRANILPLKPSIIFQSQIFESWKIWGWAWIANFLQLCRLKLAACAPFKK